MVVFAFAHPAREPRPRAFAGCGLLGFSTTRDRDAGSPAFADPGASGRALSDPPLASSGRRQDQDTAERCFAGSCGPCSTTGAASKAARQRIPSQRPFIVLAT